jgi:hypothetical protein
VLQYLDNSIVFCGRQMVRQVHFVAARSHVRRQDDQPAEMDDCNKLPGSLDGAGCGTNDNNKAKECQRGSGGSR